MTRDLATALAAATVGRPAPVDRLTLRLGDVLLAGRDVAAESRRLAEALALARRFRDAAGRLNRSLAAAADRVALAVAGLPMEVK